MQIKNPFLQKINYSYIIWIFALLSIVAIGIYVRMLGWSEWDFLSTIDAEKPLPILANADGYFYLSLARDWLEGHYYSLEPWRVYPESPARPEFVPLLSWLAAFFTPLTSYPIEYTAVILPAILGALVAIPVAFLVQMMADRWIAVWAAVVAVLVPYFSHRTGLGWFDTDGLTVLFPLLQVLLAALLLNKLHYIQKILILCIYLIVSILFFIAWDQAPHVVVALSFYPILLVWIARWKFKSLRYSIFILIGVMLWLLPGDFLSTIQGVIDLARYILADPQSGSSFSPTAKAIGEQDNITISLIARENTGNVLLLMLVAIGLIYIAWKSPILVLLTAPFAAIAVMGFFHAERFLIFFMPMVAIGAAGFLLGTKHFLMTQSIWVRNSIVGIVGLFFAIPIGLATIELHKDRAPIISLSVIEPMRDLAEVLPDDAVIWNVCDHGYALIYWTRFITTCDGSSHSALRRTAMSVPLHANSPEYAAHFMHLFAMHGEKGIRRVLALNDDNWLQARNFLGQAWSQQDLAHWLQHGASHGFNLSEDEAQEWKRYLLPESSRPLYLVLDRQTMRNTHWWYWFSTWDSTQGRGIHPYYILFPHVPVANADGVIQDAQNLFVIDTTTGAIRFRDQHIRLRDLSVTKDQTRSNQQFPTESYWMMDIVYNQQSGYAVLYDPLTKGTMGHQLFVNRSESPLFESVYSLAPELQVWRVQAVSALAPKKDLVP